MTTRWICGLLGVLVAGAAFAHEPDARQFFAGPNPLVIGQAADWLVHANAGLLLGDLQAFPYQGYGCGGDVAPGAFAQQTLVGRFER